MRDPAEAYQDWGMVDEASRAQSHTMRYKGG
jgi:hypothetical protein